MSRSTDLALTALAPLVWGSTYLVSTVFLPAGHPLGIALTRALPAGLLLLVLVRHLPPRGWWLRLAVLGALNFSLFWWLLFVTAYRLPGGVAATVLGVQPLFALFLTRLWLGAPLRPMAIGAALAGMAGVGLLILNRNASLDAVGVVAGLAGAFSMASGTALSRVWQPPVPPLTFTAWQLTFGGLLLLPAALLAEGVPPVPTLREAMALAYLGLIGAALTYILWFRGLARLGPQALAPLAFLSPLAATALGWAVRGETFTAQQWCGIAVVLASVWAGQRAASGPAPSRAA